MRRFAFASIGLFVLVSCDSGEPAKDGTNPDEDICVYDGAGRFTCAGESWPRCEGNATSESCEKSADLCMACKDGVAAVVCSCGDPDGGALATWLCRGTGRGCR